LTEGIHYSDTGWDHPLSPYYLDRNDTGITRPTHLQPGGFSYRFWPQISIGDSRHILARLVRHFLHHRKEICEQTRIFAFGYDMDNMKARCWYETTIPLYLLPEDIRQIFEKRVEQMVTSAEEIADHLRNCVKEAWLDSDPKKNQDRKKKIREKLAYIHDAFFEHTHQMFKESLAELPGCIDANEETCVLERWHAVLCKTALNLFDYWVSSEDIAYVDVRRVAKAHEKLRNLIHGKKLWTSLGINLKKEKVA